VARPAERALRRGTHPDLETPMHRITRRDFVSATLALPAVLASRSRAAGRAEITVGITVDTRPDWNGAENFIRSIDEASAVGFHNIETFWNYVERWAQNPQGLKDELAKRNLRLETVSNGGRMRVNFIDPRERAGTIEDHLKLASFVRQFDCDHMKINCGARPKDIDQRRAEYCREMSVAFNEIGRRVTDMGMKFGIHGHLGSPFQIKEEVDRVMDLTDPKHVYFVCDTGHVTMAGMDPVQVTRTYLPRIIEYHIKDTAAGHKGGFKGTLTEPYNTRADNRIFFELGTGGVDFPAIKALLDGSAWMGWWTVELDRTGSTAKESCTIARKYLEDRLKLMV
jgi:inosose dehydratase